MFDDIPPRPDGRAKTELAHLFYAAADTLLAPESPDDQVKARQLLTIARDIAAAHGPKDGKKRRLR